MYKQIINGERVFFNDNGKRIKVLEKIQDKVQDTPKAKSDAKSKKSKGK